MADNMNMNVHEDDGLDPAALAQLELQIEEIEGNIVLHTVTAADFLPTDATSQLAANCTDLVMYGRSSKPLHVTDDLPLLVAAALDKIYTAMLPEMPIPCRIVPLFTKSGDNTGVTTLHFYIVHSLAGCPEALVSVYVMRMATAVMKYFTRLPLDLGDERTITLNVDFTEYGAYLGVRGYTPCLTGIPAALLDNVARDPIGPLGRYSDAFIGSVAAAAQLPDSVTDAPKETVIDPNAEVESFLSYLLHYPPYPTGRCRGVSPCL